MVYDALDMTYRTIKIRKDPETPKITELIDYEAFCGVVSEEAAEAAADSTVTPHELRDMLDAGRKVALIDVREPVEWEHQPHRRRRTDPQVRPRGRRRPGEAAARPHAGAVLQDGRSFRRGLGRG